MPIRKKTCSGSRCADSAAAADSLLRGSRSATACPCHTPSGAYGGHIDAHRKSSWPRTANLLQRSRASVPGLCRKLQLGTQPQLHGPPFAQQPRYM